ncbi:MAG: GTP 3',8-cyclase MoaA [Eubacterium ramulus]
MITDHYNRNIDYIRISITDRCNLRCRYCMPEDISFVGHDKILRYEEITRIVQILAQRGITKVKITGGEPLVRHECTDLIREIKEIPGIEMVTLTTNGILLQSMLPKLLEAGVDAVNVSLDTFQRARYEHLTGKDACEMVLAGIQDAYKSGIPLKLNCVPIEGENTDELSEFFSWAKRKQIAVRFY